MAKSKQPFEMTRFEILSELSKLNEEEEARSEGLSPVVMHPVEKIRRKALLKHQLKLLEMKTADGQDAKALEEHWKRQAEEEQKKQQALEEAEKNRLETARNQAKEEIQADTDGLAELIASWPEDKRNALLEKLKEDDYADKN